MSEAGEIHGFCDGIGLNNADDFRTADAEPPEAPQEIERVFEVWETLLCGWRAGASRWRVCMRKARSLQTTHYDCTTP